MTKTTLNGCGEGDNVYIPLDERLWPRDYKTGESVSQFCPRLLFLYPKVVSSGSPNVAIAKGCEIQDGRKFHLQYGFTLHVLLQYFSTKSFIYSSLHGGGFPGWGSSSTRR